MKSYPEMIADTKADIAKLDKRIAELKKQKGNSKNMPLSERIDKLEDARACTYYNLRGMEEYLAAHPEEVTIMNETEQSGKESDMGKNNATFLWSPGRRAKLENLHQEGASVYAIARYFGVDAAKVEFAMKKYSIHQKPKKPVVNEEFEMVFGSSGGEKNDKRKINYPSFAWSPKRQEKLAELYSSGASIPDICAHFGIADESTGYKAIDKYGLVRSFSPDSAAEAPAPPPAPQQSSINQDFENVFNPDPPLAALPPSPPSAQTTDTKHLNELLHYIVDAANHNNDIMAFLTEAKEDHAFFDLGQQAVKLHEATKIIKNLLNNSLES